MCNFISFYRIKKNVFAENEATELLWASFMWYNNFQRLERSRYLKVVYHRSSSCLSFKMFVQIYLILQKGQNTSKIYELTINSLFINKLTKWEQTCQNANMWVNWHSTNYSAKYPCRHESNKNLFSTKIFLRH